MHAVIFEGSYWGDTAPLSLSRPTFTLGAGTGTLLDKHIRFIKPTRLTLWVRPELAEWCRENLVKHLSIPTKINEPLDEEPAMIVAGRTLYLANLEAPPAPCVVVEENNLIRMAYVKSPGLKREDMFDRSDAWMKLFDLPRTMPPARFIARAWDLISWNEEALIVDSLAFRETAQPAPEARYHLCNGEDVLVGHGAKLLPGCVLDASRGPIMIGKGATIGSNAVIQGPCYIGDYSSISPLASIRPGTSIGPVCKVGGEVSNSIIFGCSNKAHDGFLGDSYVGKWVNLGAGTTTSNLKNTYGEIEMLISEKGDAKPIPTGRRMLGSIIGDHTKTAIGTRLTTGSYVGYNCMLATPGLTPKFVPSFTFLTDRGPEPFKMEKAMEVATRMLARRNRDFTEVEANVMRYAERAAKAVER